MNFIKMTTNGQVTIPKAFRAQLGTEYFVCELEGNTVLFRPVEISKHKKKSAKYTMDDLRAFSFEGKNPDETLADKIDDIVYDF